MGCHSKGWSKAWAMVQDLLIQAYVYRHAAPNTDDCALAAVQDLLILDAL